MSCHEHNQETIERQDIKNLEKSVLTNLPWIDSIQQGEEIEILQRPNDWLQSIENRVLLLHFEKPQIGLKQTHYAQKLSFYGTFL